MSEGIGLKSSRHSCRSASPLAGRVLPDPAEHRILTPLQSFLGIARTCLSLPFLSCKKIQPLLSQYWQSKPGPKRAQRPQCSVGSYSSAFDLRFSGPWSAPSLSSPFKPLLIPKTQLGLHDCTPWRALGCFSGSGIGPQSRCFIGSCPYKKGSSLALPRWFLDLNNRRKRRCYMYPLSYMVQILAPILSSPLSSGKLLFFFFLFKTIALHFQNVDVIWETVFCFQLVPIIVIHY